MTSHRIIFDKQSTLQLYVMRQDYDKLEECLQSKDYDINNGHFMMSFLDDTIPFSGWTGLHLSAANNDITSAQLLLRYGADINSRTNKHWYTPLHIAVKNECQQMTQLLIKSKADLNSKDSAKKTPLELCLNNDFLSTLLVESGADYSGNHFEKHPLIFRAIDEKNLSLVQLLARLQLRGVEHNKKCPVEYAMDVFPECVSYLIGCGKQIYFKNEETGEYPIHLAIRMTQFIWIKMLCQQRCDVNVGNRDGNRPLHIAIQNDCPIEVVLLLISSGAKPNLKNFFGLTPICYAVEKGNVELTKTLLAMGSLLSRNLSELERAIRFKKFKAALILLNHIPTINNRIQFDSEPIIWFFVKHCVGEHDSEATDLTTVMKKLIDMTSDVNTIDSVWGSLMHFLVYADVCAPTHCFKPLFDVLICSHKCDINYEFKPTDTRLKNGDEVPVERIMANGTALSFALEMAKCNHYSEQLIGIGADHSTINWDHIFFAPEKVKSLKMLVYSGCPIPDYFREDADPTFNDAVPLDLIQHYTNEFEKFISWWDRQKGVPLTLKQSSRNVVRKEIGSTGLRKLATGVTDSHMQTIPKVLSDYLLFKSYEDFEEL